MPAGGSTTKKRAAVLRKGTPPRRYRTPSQRGHLTHDDMPSGGHDFTPANRQQRVKQMRRARQGKAEMPMHSMSRAVSRKDRLIQQVGRDQQRLENKFGRHPIAPREMPGWPDHTAWQDSARFAKALGLPIRGERKPKKLDIERRRRYRRMT